MSRTQLCPIVMAGSLLVLTGCGEREPYHRTDVWRPTGANAANLAAMVANPHDLIRGRGDRRQSSKEAEAAVERTWTPPAAGATGGGGAGGGGVGGASGGGAASSGSGS